MVDVLARKVHFRAWNFTLDCMIPDEKPQKKKNIQTVVNGAIAKEEIENEKFSPAPVTMTSSQNSNSEPQSLNPTANFHDSTARSVQNSATSANFSPNPNLPKCSNFAPPHGIRMDGKPAYYRQLLLSEFDDILVDQLLNELPPLREINHRIPYTPKKPWIGNKYRLPEAHKAALSIRSYNLESYVTHPKYHSRHHIGFLNMMVNFGMSKICEKGTKTPNR